MGKIILSSSRGEMNFVYSGEDFLVYYIINNVMSAMGSYT